MYYIDTTHVIHWCYAHDWHCTCTALVLHRYSSGTTQNLAWYSTSTPQVVCGTCSGIEQVLHWCFTATALASIYRTHSAPWAMQGNDAPERAAKESNSKQTNEHRPHDCAQCFLPLSAGRPRTPRGLPKGILWESAEAQLLQIKHRPCRQKLAMAAVPDVEPPANDGGASNRGPNT